MKPVPIAPFLLSFFVKRKLMLSFQHPLNTERI